MSINDFSMQAIYQAVEIVPYDSSWPTQFELERNKLLSLFPGTFTAIEHVGSTAVKGLAAKPIIDLIATVSSMGIADDITQVLVKQNCGYLFSADFNAELGDRRWLMKHSNGRRTHHLHLVLPDSEDWLKKIRFRDLLRVDRELAERYVQLKISLAHLHRDDREAYTEAKTSFIDAALAK